LAAGYSPSRVRGETYATNLCVELGDLPRRFHLLLLTTTPAPCRSGRDIAATCSALFAHWMPSSPPVYLPRTGCHLVARLYGITYLFRRQFEHGAGGSATPPAFGLC